MTIPTLRLNNGYTMPQVGLGTASLNDDTVAPVIVTAIEAGYRHIDTAYRYGNQRGVGKGIRDSGIHRVAIPRSSNPERLAQNIDIFDFTLTADEVAAISALDTGAEKRVDSDTMGH
jgi:diketogulonate reductase-like aldo/keto reductase